MNFQIKQARNIGLKLERLPAFDTTMINPDPDDEFWGRWQRPLRNVEKAAALSHHLAWSIVAKSNSPYLILEDDALLSSSVPSFLNYLKTLSGVDYVSLETRGRKKIVGKKHQGFAGIRSLLLDRTGAAAYVLWPSGAEKLIDRFSSVAAIADAVLIETPGLLRWQADPALAVQMDMATRYQLEPPFQIKSSISSVARPKSSGFAYRLRRINGQLRFLYPHMLLMAGAEKKEVLPDFGNSN